MACEEGWNLGGLHWRHLCAEVLGRLGTLGL